MGREGSSEYFIVLVVIVWSACNTSHVENTRDGPSLSAPSPVVVDSASGTKVSPTARAPGPAVVDAGSEAKAPDGGQAVDEPSEAKAALARPSVDLTRLFLAGVKASTELNDGGTVYLASWAADGNHRTAWGAKRRQYRDEWLELSFSRPVTVTQLKVLTGYCSNSRSTGADMFPINRRLKQVRISLGTYKDLVHNFDDDREWQTVTVDPPVTDTKIRLTVLDVYQGTRYPDLHVSEIAVWGTAEGAQGRKHAPISGPCSKQALEAAVTLDDGELDEEKIRKLLGLKQYFFDPDWGDEGNSFIVHILGYKVGRFHDSKCHEVMVSHGQERNDWYVHEVAFLRLVGKRLKVFKRLPISSKSWEGTGRGGPLNCDFFTSWLPDRIVDFDHDGQQELLLSAPEARYHDCTDLAALYRAGKKRMELLFFYPVMHDSLCAKKRDLDGSHGPPHSKIETELFFEDLDGDRVDELIAKTEVFPYDLSGKLTGKSSRRREIFRYNGTKFVKHRK